MSGVLINPFVLFPPAPPDGDADPLWEYVTMLIQGETDIVDVRGHAITIHVAGVTGISNSGGEIALTRAGTKDAIQVDGSDGAFSPGTGQFCVEGVFRAASSNTGYQMLFTNGSGASSAALNVELSTVRKLYVYSDASIDLAYTGFPLDNSHHHIAIMRDASNVFALAVDGTVVARRVSVVNNFNSPVGKFCIGNYQQVESVSFVGGAKWVRFTKGHARYPTGLGDTFDVPVAALPDH